MENPAAFRLVACLGNPGPQYRNTRHNIGFLVADELARRSVADFSFQSQWNSETAKVGGRTLMKPQTFMNLSGRAVQAILAFHKWTPAEMLVVYDDVALPLGALRFREKGSAGGHNGIKSIIEHLGTQEFPRLKVGIGASQPDNMVGHVLGKFTPDEQSELQNTLAMAVKAVQLARSQGLATAANRFNQSKPTPIPSGTGPARSA